MIVTSSSPGAYLHASKSSLADRDIEFHLNTSTFSTFHSLVTADVLVLANLRLVVFVARETRNRAVPFRDHP